MGFVLILRISHTVSSFMISLSPTATTKSNMREIHYLHPQLHFGSSKDEILDGWNQCRLDT